MFNLTISLNDGRVIDASTENFSAQDYAQNVNGQNLVMITIGKTIINKSTINNIVYSEDVTPNVTIELFNGEPLKAYVETFDELSIANEFNNPRSIFVAVGNVIVNKNTVKLITQI